MDGINIELQVARLKEKISHWIDFYNNECILGALLYLTMADYFEGRKESRLAERREKLHAANIKENLIEFGGIIDYKGKIEKQEEPYAND